MIQADLQDTCIQHEDQSSCQVHRIENGLEKKSLEEIVNYGQCGVGRWRRQAKESGIWPVYKLKLAVRLVQGSRYPCNFSLSKLPSEQHILE